MMATVYVDVTLGNDAAAGTIGAPWKSPLKANASATANDTASIVSGTYPSTDYTGAPDHFSITKPLIYDAQTDGSVTFTSTSALYVGRISTSMASGTLTFNGVVLDAASAKGQVFQVGADATKDYVLTGVGAEWVGIKNTGIGWAGSRGSLISTGDAFTGGGVAAGATVAAINSSNSDLGASESAGGAADRPFTLTLTSPTITLAAPTDAQICYGVNLSSAATRLSAVTYTINGGTIDVSANAGSYARAINLVGGSVVSVSGTTITATSSNASAETAGIRVTGRGASSTSNNAAVSGNIVHARFPAGHAITFGGSTADSYMTSPVSSGNIIDGIYYASNTPHGITFGQAVVTALGAGDVVSNLYANFLASKTTSGTRHSSISRDSYGVDYYAKGCTAFTYTGNTAIQTGKYARRNLAPFSIDSQGGTATTATTFSYNTFICAEADFTRVGALANITNNNNGTFTSNTYIVPDTWDTDTTDRFFVGGTEGGRAGATGYTIDEWITGTAGSVSATNGTGTIAISGEKVIRMPIAQIMELVYNQPSTIGGRSILGPNGWIVPPISG